MELSVELYKMVLVLAIAQCVMLTVLFGINKKNPHRANRYISALFICLSLPLLNELFELVIKDRRFLILFLLSKLAMWVQGPLLYLYILQFSNREHLKLTKLKKHLISPVLGLLSIIFVGLSSESQNSIYMMLILWQIVIFVYVFLSIRRLLEFKSELNANLSTFDNSKLKWLEYLTYSLSILITVDFLESIYTLSFNYYPVFLPGSLVFILSASILIVIGYVALVQAPIQLEQVILKKEEKKYLTSSLSRVEIDKIIKGLKVAEKDKLFLQSSITLASLSEAIGCSLHALSQVLNQKLELSFHDYINKMRIDMAANMLREPSSAKVSIIDICFNCGFNNKVSFNNAFKKHHDMTPGQYRAANKPH